MTSAANNCASLHFYIYPGGGSIPSTDLDPQQVFGMIPFGAATGNTFGGTSSNGAIVPGNGTMRVLNHSGTSNFWLHPQILSSSSYTVKARIHCATADAQSDLSVFACFGGGNASNGTTNCAYQVGYDSAVGVLYLNKLLNGSLVNGGASPWGASVAFTFTSGQNVIVRMKVVQNANGTATISAWYSTNDQLTWISIGSFTDSSPLTGGQWGVQMVAINSSLSDTVGFQIGDLVASTNALADATVTQFTTITNAQNAYVISPAGVSASTPLPLLTCPHGAGALGNFLSPGVTTTVGNDQMAAYLSLPARVLTCDAEGDNWGNSASQQDYVDARTHARANFASTIDLMDAGSMGGLDGILLLANGLIPFVGMFLDYAVCNLAEEYALSFTSSINTAYGITGTAPNTYALLTAGHDPMTLNSAAVLANYAKAFWRFTGSPADTTVPKNLNMDVFINFVLSVAAAGVSTVTSQGAHGDVSNNLPQDAYQFFRQVIAANTVSLTSTTVTQNTGGYHNLQATVDGVASAGVKIVAYLQSDYVAGNQVIQGTTFSDPTGGFSSTSPTSKTQGLTLASGNTYVLAYYVGNQQVYTKTISI